MRVQSGRKRGAPARGLAIIVIVLLLAIIALLILLLVRGNSGSGQLTTSGNRDPNAALGQIKGKTKEEIQAELDKIVEEGMFNISINSDIVFKRGDGEGDVRIENIAANHHLMSVAIVRDDTGETIYETAIIEPGYHIQSDTLDVVLPKGVYPCTARFTVYDSDTEEPVGQAGAKVTITVEN